MNKWLAAAVVVLTMTLSQRGYAALSASATISSQQVGPGSWQYTLTLQNTGTTPIGTYWFAWIPGYDLLPTMPTNVNSPGGWTGDAAMDYFGVGSARWVNTASPLQPGNSMTGFQFTSSDSPSTLGGLSSFFGTPVNESYVYIGAPETDPGFAFRPATVPEPASLTLAAFGAAALIRRRR